MKVQIIGHKGSMGTRYKAILRSLYVKQSEHLDLNEGQLDKGATHFIIATPTDTHMQWMEMLPHNVSVMCEKPLAKNVKDVINIIEIAKRKQIEFRMTHQYVHLITEHLHILMREKLYNNPKKAISSYNYFRHGNDGIVWDCLQIIALGKDKPILREDSPTWSCAIHGIKISNLFMDAAYVEDVLCFLHTKPPKYLWWDEDKPDYLNWLIHIHKKAEEMEAVRA